MEVDGAAVGIESSESSARAHNIVIVHAFPLIRLGLASTITDITALSGYSISTFKTLHEAELEISKAEMGDAIILDLGAWSSLINSKNSAAFQRINARGLPLGVIASEAQIKIGRLERSSFFRSIILEAGLNEIVAVIEDLTANRHNIIKERILLDRSSQLSLLTRREMKILELMTQGLSNKQIARELGVTEASVKYHVTKMPKKLGCNQRTQAVVAFMQSLR